MDDRAGRGLQPRPNRFESTDVLGCYEKPANGVTYPVPAASAIPTVIIDIQTSYTPNHLFFALSETTQMKTKIATLIALALLVMINFSIWSYINNPLQLQPWTKTTMGVTYDPMRKQDTQTSNTFPSEADMDKDLSLLADKVHAVRTYSVLKGQHKVPELAAKHNLNTTVGAWIDGNLEKNRQEIETLLQVSNQNNPKIVRVMVGNEVLFRNNIPVQQLIDYIREVKKRTWRPVSTSETFDIWLKHPELVAEVDFIGTHILPYWNGIAADDAVDFVFEKYHELQKAYPKKSDRNYRSRLAFRRTTLQTRYCIPSQSGEVFARIPQSG